MTTVLFTCAGQRVDIVSAFGRAGATTLAVDVNPLAPALYHADRYELVRRVDDPGYVLELTALVAEHDIDLIVPLTDLDQLILARARNDIAVPVLLSPADVVEQMGDKYLAHAALGRLGLASPPSWLPEDLPADLRYPVAVKAREGFGSRHIYAAHDASELEYHLAHTPVPSFVQSWCLGEEFSIDVFCDLTGTCLNAIPRTMIESKGGESIKGMTIKDWELIEHGRRVAEALPIWGPANIQCFREEDGSLLCVALSVTAWLAMSRCSSRTSTPASAARSHYRSRREAATRSWPLRSPRESTPSRRSASSAKGSS